ncbi:hypothetical protein F4825DRAFT_472060 [Nemania diffusa]|nr:hypothetical protein F4825DRAFT_472060 [Nemania diffusa]
MSRKRRSRGDRAQAQSIVHLLNSTPTIRRAGVRNSTRKITAKGYQQFLEIIGDPKDNSVPPGVLDTVQFEYSCSRERFEVQMQTPIHSGMQELFDKSIREWQESLRKSSDTRISDIAETFSPVAGRGIKFSKDTETLETKAPNLEIRHTCKRGVDHRCYYPTLVLEVGWTQTKEQLREKAEGYINHSNGQIRTVVAVDMHKMYLAEQKNEHRLKQMNYHNSLKDTSKPYSYSEDESNETGSASILVWRAKKEKGALEIGNTIEETFRDSQGKAVQSGLLRIPLHDFICVDMASFYEGKLEAPLLEISSNRLCEGIQNMLKKYREQRGMTVRDTVQHQKRKNIKKKVKEEEQLRKDEEARIREAGDWKF